MAAGFIESIPGFEPACGHLPERRPPERTCLSANRRSSRTSYRDEGNRRGMIRKLKFFLEMIKFEHTIFALPFAFMGALLGGVVMEHRLPQWSEIGWILLAMIGARTAA